MASAALHDLRQFQRLGERRGGRLVRHHMDTGPQRRACDREMGVVWRHYGDEVDAIRPLRLLAQHRFIVGIGAVNVDAIRFPGLPGRSGITGEGPGDQPDIAVQFGSPAIIPLQAQIKDDWADNLIGAQYLEMPKGSQTRVRLTVRSLDPQEKVYILLKAKELEQDVPLGLPEEMLVTGDQPLEMNFSFDNPESRKAFSFHLLGYGVGAIEVSDFTVITEDPGQPESLDDIPDEAIVHSS